jgi:cytochrome c peroxidase
MAGSVSLALLLTALALGAGGPRTPEAPVVLADAERTVLLELSPLPEPPPDPTNSVHADPAAARLGQALFFDPRLSADGTVSCATCHVPEKSWTDGRALARGISGLPRHTMTLWNVAHNRWFFWDGRKDTLWSQALAPLEDEREHGTSRLAVLHVLHADEGYRRAYADVFGPLPELADERRFPQTARPAPHTPEHPHHVAWESMSAADQEAATRAFVNVGKALAAFQRGLVSRSAPFDVFVAGLRTGDAAKLAAISPAAQRGAALFAGKARCFLCHDGPLFSDLEFHDNRVPVGEEGGDPGRKLGIRRLQADPLNSRSVFADDGGETGRLKVGLLVSDSHGGNLFKTPTLRNVARTAPYMHEGQLATLADVVRFYDTLEGAAPETSGEKILQPLGLTEAERADLVAFLESLTDESLPDELRGPPPTPYLER